LTLLIEALARLTSTSTTSSSLLSAGMLEMRRDRERRTVLADPYTSHEELCRNC
jgi:hypothetical protein